MKANPAPQPTKKLRLLALWAGLAALSMSCSQQRAIIPAPQPSVTPRPAPPPPPPSAPQVTNWRDAPITPGTWHWRMEGARSVARFDTDALVLSCNREAGSITLMRPGTASGPVPVTIQTSTATRTLSASPEAGPPPVITLSLAARDGLLDAMAFSRGRFAVEVAGLPTLYVPSWTEVSRVIEDCR